MAHPHDAGESKAQEKGKIRRPLAQQCGCQRTLTGVRDLDFEDQQGNGNGKDAVRERFNARCFRLHGFYLTRLSQIRALSSFIASAYGARAIPRSVMIAVTYFAGVTSNAGFSTSTPSGAICLPP